MLTLCLYQAMLIAMHGLFILGMLMLAGTNTPNSRKLVILYMLLYLASYMLPADPHGYSKSVQLFMGKVTFWVFKMCFRAFGYLIRLIFSLPFIPIFTLLRYSTRLFRFITWTLFVISGVFAHAAPGDDPYGPVIGIDLGTTYSCVGVYRNDRVEIIANSQGARTTPSWVSIRNTEQIVGEGAKHALHAYPSQTIYSVKRLIGRTFDDPALMGDIAKMTFRVANRTGRPVIQVKEQGLLRELTPEEVSAMVLRSMKETAEAYLGTKVTRAVITVPAYFNDAQRQATKDAGRIAGLTVLRILNEPTAAAIAYGLDRRQESSRVLVYDLGGGTFDVSLLHIQGETFKVLATAGDARLGGEDFDHRIVDYFVKLYHQKFGVDITQVQRSMAKLKKEAERTKRLLSNAMTAELEIESFYRGRDFSATLSRAKFEQLNIDLFRRTLVLVQRVLNDAKLTAKDIDEIVLVGGSTRIPKIHQILTDMFGGKRPSQGINPDEPVAIGAAISGGMLSGKDSLASVSLDDVCPFTIGIETAGGIFTPFIRRNSPVPVSHTKILSTLEDNQSAVLIQVYEGEHDRTEHNTLIGEFEMTGIPPTARGAVQLEVKFELDANGILFVGAKEKFTGNTKSITISSRRSGLTEEELNRIISQSGEYFGTESEDELEGGDGPQTYRLSEDKSTPRDTHTEDARDGVANSVTDLNEVGSKSGPTLILSVEQAAILRTEKMRRLEGLIMSLEERLRDGRRVDALTNTSRNLTAIEVTVREIQFWRAEESFTASLAEIDDVIHTLAELDQSV
ncbi:ATPase with role in protein import into the ER [Ceratobasidium sp. 423]|nr:ATPase with role in protein import into the ER [Ceratobasidium sp. 423]